MHTVIRFINEGWDVTGLDNLNDYYSTKLKLDRLETIMDSCRATKVKFDFIKADLNSDVWTDLSKQKIDAIVHLAAQAGVRYSLQNPMAYLESNILGFQKVLDYAKHQNIEKFLFASSSSVYGKDSSQPFSEDQACNSPESYYAATKKSNELMAKSYWNTFRTPSIGLRFFTVYGPFGRPDMAPMLFADAAKRGNPIKVFNHGHQQRDFTFIDDIVEGIFNLIKLEEFPKDSLVINIGNGSPIDLMKFISILENEMQVKLKKEFMEAQKGDVSVTFASTEKLEELTGYKPIVNLEEGIKRFVRWFKTYEYE